LISLFGTQLATFTQQANRRPLPYTMAGASATVNGIPAPLHYVSPGQINLQIPYEAGAGPATIAVNNGGQIAAYPVNIGVTAPGLFGIWDPQGRPVTSVQQGQTYSAYITGEGDVTPTLASGATPPAGTALTKLPKARQPLSVTIGGIPADLPFWGISSGLVGVTQINFTVPASAPAGPQPFVVNVGGAPSQELTVNVTAAN
jgi:uncharacterized protein (TIGR03437 family)